MRLAGANAAAAREAAPSLSGAHRVCNALEGGSPELHVAKLGASRRIPVNGS
jgi:hypothetical protein